MSADTINPTQSAVYAALGAFITSTLGLSTGQVIQGYPNRVAMPPLGGFVVMAMINAKRLRTNIDVTPSGANPTTQTMEQGTQLDIQLDVYGPSAGDWAQILTTVLRDDVGCVALAPTCQPLYADDPIRAPLDSAEEQYEDRWIIQAMIQYNPVVTVPLQYADALGPVGIIDAQQQYHP